MKLAFENVSGSSFVLDQKLLDELIEASHYSPRRRMLLPIHRTQEAPVQRMLNCIQPLSYIRPHLHPRKQATETISVLKGEFLCLLFDDKGQVTASHRLTPQLPHSMLDIEPNLWHTFWALKPDSIILEIKGGPYDAKQDKIWPDWAPDENAPEAAKFMETILSKYSV